MPGKVNRTGLVCSGFIGNDDLIFISKKIGHKHIQVPRIPFFHVGAQVVQLKSHSLFRFKCFSLPDLFIKTNISAMQGVFAVIFSQNIGLTVKFKTGIGNPVSIPANYTTKIGMTVKIGLQFIKTQCDIAKPGVPVRYLYGCDNAAIICNFYYHAVGIGQCVKFYFFTINRTEGSGYNTRFYIHACFVF